MNSLGEKHSVNVPKGLFYLRQHSNKLVLPVQLRRSYCSSGCSMKSEEREWEVKLCIGFKKVGMVAATSFCRYYKFSCNDIASSLKGDSHYSL